MLCVYAFYACHSVSKMHRNPVESLNFGLMSGLKYDLNPKQTVDGEKSIAWLAPFFHCF